MDVIYCKDCKYQNVVWHEDKRRLAGGYFVYGCECISDPFMCTPVWGLPEQFCSGAERKGGADMRGDKNGDDE